MKSLIVWILQTGEPLHIDENDARPMRAMNLSNALTEKGHKVVLWSTAFSHLEKRHRSLIAQSIRVSNNLEIRLIPSRGYRHNIGIGRLVDHAQLAFNLKMMIQQMETLPDVAFIGYPPIETAAVLVRWLSMRGVPSLLDVKDQWPLLFLNAVPAPLRPLGRVVIRPYFNLARRAMRDAIGLSTMADSFLDWALGFAERERTYMDGVFPLTSAFGQVNALKLEEARLWWDQQGIEDDGRPSVCFVGSHSSAFDFKPVKEAAELAVNGQTPCEFIICGDGSSSLGLQAMMSGLPNFHFPGWIDRPQIEALAERCQAMLAPYHNKEDFRMSLPNKIIDALSLGLPILSPLKGEVATLIEEYGVGMRYDTDTGRSLYDCIQVLAKDPALQKSMSQKARALYEERFSFDKVYDGLVKHLEMLASYSAKTQK
jgi:glycosyltransferase involved in cell wall biosynthesis